MTRSAAPERRPAKRRWGQHFLIDGNIVKKIVDCAKIESGESVLEIGPGRGILTEALLARGAKLCAIEIDPALIAYLERRFGAFRPASCDLVLVHGDALAYAYEGLSAPYKVVANLPYNISSPLLFRLLEEDQRISLMVLMLQKEVAERIVAGPAEKAYGTLSVMLQYYADVEILFQVSPDCFRPRPKVGSTVLRLKPLAKPKIQIQDEALFKRIVKGAFQHRRKQLPKALGSAGFDEASVRAALRRMEIDPKRRGETLSLQDFAALADTLSALIPLR